MTDCIAPGHPDCRINCPRGCVALFVEPHGPCRTACVGAPVPVAADAIFSITISDMQADDVITVIGDILDEDVVLALRGRTDRIFLSLIAISRDELIAELRRLL